MTTGTEAKRRAVFLDRDGTLIHDAGYIATPSKVHLLPGVAEALRLLEQEGYLRVVITNQSGIGRGLFTEAEFGAVEREFETQLEQSKGATVSAVYHCPHREEEGCACRKPGLLLYRKAADELGIDLASSWCLGDRLNDLLPARGLGARACLVLTGEGEHHSVRAEEEGFHVAEDLLQAVTHRILGE